MRERREGGKERDRGRERRKGKRKDEERGDGVKEGRKKGRKGREEERKLKVILVMKYYIFNAPTHYTPQIKDDCHTYNL